MPDMLILAERVRNTIELGESHFREFKSAWEGRPGQKKARRWGDVAADIGEALVAFANADGGDLLVGVEDDGKITGVPHNGDDLNLLLQATKSHVHKNSILPLQSASSLTMDGLTVLFFSVGKGTTGVFQLPDGRCVRRSGKTTVPESVDRILFDQREARSRAYDSEFVDGAKVTDLDLDILQSISDRYLRGITPEKYLQQIGLGEYGQGGLRLKRAALFLFAKDISRWHPRCQIRFLKVLGTTLKPGAEYNVGSDESVQGNILDLLVKSWEALRPSLAYKTQLGKDVKFEQKYLYPEWACREALINAIGHRDYSIQGGVDVFVFDDRIEIKSPGALLSTISLDQLKRLEGAHESRNSLVARTLRELGYMRELGEGMKQIFQLMEERDLQKPALSSDETSFTVTLYNKSVFSKDQLSWLALFEGINLSPYQQRIVIAGMHDRELSPDEIYKAMNTSDRDTYDKEVTGLRQAGLLSEIRTNAQANQIAKSTKQKKGAIARFKVIMPGSIIEFPVRPILVTGKIAVFNLPVSATGEEIKDVFAKYGTVLQVQLPATRPHFENRFAFVTFSDAKPVDILLSQKTSVLFKGSTLKIERYREKGK